MSDRVFKKYKKIGTSILVLCVLAILLITPLSVAKKSGINLPDGIYMYDSSVQRLKDGSDRVGFGKFFVVYKKYIYSSKDIFKKLGISKLNELFGGEKKYKILFSGEVVGEKYNLRFQKDEAFNREDAVFFCDELYNAKNIKEGPAYGRKSIYLGRFGSAAKCLAVPEEYKEVKKKNYTTIAQEEVDKIAKLAKERLFDLVKNRKEIMKYKTKESKIIREELELLDKIFHHNDAMYIGIYRYIISKKGEYDIVLSIKKDKIHVITSNYDDETLLHAGVRIQGMIDVDGCGSEELIIQKTYGGYGQSITNIEIYKQKADGNWALIKKIKWREKI